MKLTCQQMIANKWSLDYYFEITTVIFIRSDNYILQLTGNRM